MKSSLMLLTRAAPGRLLALALPVQRAHFASRTIRVTFFLVWAVSAVMGVACAPSRQPADDAIATNQESLRTKEPGPSSHGQTCVVDGDSLLVIDFTLASTRDTLVNGVPFGIAYPVKYPPYVAGVAWYLSDKPVRFGGLLYARNDPPQIARPEWLKFAGHYRGVPVFKAVEDDIPGVIFLPVRPGCVFQPLTGLVGHDEPG